MRTLKDEPLYYQVAMKLLMAALIITFLMTGRELFIPLTIAIFYAFLLLPVSRKLERIGLNRAVAIIISIILAMAFFGGLVYFFFIELSAFSDDWPELQQQIYKKIERFQQYIFETFDVDKNTQKNWLRIKIKETANSGDKIVMGIFNATGAFLVGVTLIPIYIFFLTFYREKFKHFIALIYNDDKSGKVISVISKVSKVSQAYLKGIFLDVLILSVLNSTGFLLLGIKHAILFGVLASLLNIIPYIGVLIGSILPMAMALLTKDEIGYTIGVGLVCVVVQFIDNNFITPYVVGSSVSINPLTAILVLVVSSMVWGVAGMVLSLPLTGMLKVICDNVQGLRPYGFLIGEEVNYRERARFFKKVKS